MSRVNDAALKAWPDPPGSILVIKPSSFGDVVHALPAVCRLKKAWPEAHLAWIVNPEWAPLLADNPAVDEIVPFPRKDFRGWSGVLKFRRWCQAELADRGPGLAVDFQGLLRSAWMGRASQPQRFLGMSDAREGARWLYGRVASVTRGTPHAVERYLTTANEALRSYGREAEAHAESRLTFPLPAGEPPPGAGTELPDRFILLHPYARGQGKSLSESQVEGLCQRLSPMQVVLVGRREGGARRSRPENCFSLLNRTSLPQLIWLIRRAQAVVTVDSGPAHLAAALGRPMIAIHTWSDPRRVGPYCPDAWVWKNGLLLQMRRLPSLDEEFFHRPVPVFSERDVEAVGELAISL